MFLVCGEILYDVFTKGARGGPLRLDARPGGSPFNVAVGLARLGQPVQFAGAVSTDLLGTRLAETLAHEKVGTDFLVRKALPCTLSFASLGESGDAEYAFYAENTADRSFKIAELGRIPQSIGVIHVGSYSAVIEPIASTVAALIDAEASRRLISYDLNVRLNVEPDRALWRAQIERLSRRVHLLKGSVEDFANAYPATSVSEIVSSFLSNGVALVIVTRGAEGAAAWTNRASSEYPGKEVTVADTVGAGDSFQAAMLARLAEKALASPDRLAHLESAALGDLLSFASKAACITCQRAGADLPFRGEIETG